MKRFMQSIVLALAVTLSTVAVSQAQGLINYDKLGTTTNGLGATVYNVLDSLIADGTIVMADTSTTGIKRLGVKPWPGTAITRGRILGVAWGSIPRRTQGGVGRILIIGYHANAKMGASGLTANSVLKTGITHGCFLTTADSLSGTAGIFLGYTSTSTAANNRGKVIITRPLGFYFGTL